MKKILLPLVLGSVLSTTTLMADKHPWLKLYSVDAQQAINTNNVLWTVQHAGAIFVKNGESSRWKRISGSLSNIDVMDSGRVWGVNQEGDIYTRAGIEGSWIHIAGNLKELGVGNDGRVWGVTSNDEIYTRVGTKGCWQRVSGALNKI